MGRTDHSSGMTSRPFVTTPCHRYSVSRHGMNKMTSPLQSRTLLTPTRGESEKHDHLHRGHGQQQASLFGPSVLYMSVDTQRRSDGRALVRESAKPVSYL